MDYNLTLSGEAFFPNNKAPTAEDNYGFCQVRILDSYQKTFGYPKDKQLAGCAQFYVIFYTRTQNFLKETKSPFAHLKNGRLVTPHLWKTAVNFSKEQGGGGGFMQHRIQPKSL